MRVQTLALLGLALLPALTRAADDADADAIKHDERVLIQAGVRVDDASLLKFVKQQTTTGADEKTIAELIEQLGDDDFDKREVATAQLATVGVKAFPQLQQARGHRDPEIVFRAETVLQRIRDGTAGGVITAAVRLLGVRKPEGASEVLLAYVVGVQEEEVKEAVQDALVRLASAHETPDPVLLKALTGSGEIGKRMAGVALAPNKTPEVRKAVRKLLDDSATEVRFHVALALARAGERDALPALIALLDKVEPADAGLIEAVLFPLAGDKAPSLVVGSGTEERRRYRESWEAWFKDEGLKVDLAKLTERPKLKGHTMIVLLDKGKVVYLDEKNKPTWEIADLNFPLDAQLLDDGNVLVAEHHGNRVTERNRKGEVVWEFKTTEPLVAQRLANGNTFIATPSQLVEVNRDGKEVASVPPPGRGKVMKALRLPNGDIACVTSLGGSRFQIVDRNGKETRGFNVDLTTSGGRLEMLPNGNVLIPEMGNNQVVEYNRQGQAVWKAGAAEPINAVRLPDGNTLITTMSETRAVEVDRRGKMKWEYRSDTRVTRAWRY